MASFDFKLFRENLLSHMKAKGLKPAQLSKMAGLNPRAVKDIEEERIKNPRIQTVLALEAAMELPFGKLLGKSIDEIDNALTPECNTRLRSRHLEGGGFLLDVI